MDVCPNGSLEKANNGAKDHVKVKPDDCIDCFLCIPECPTQYLKNPVKTPSVVGEMRFLGHAPISCRPSGRGKRILPDNISPFMSCMLSP